MNSHMYIYVHTQTYTTCTKTYMHMCHIDIHTYTCMHTHEHTYHMHKYTCTYTIWACTYACIHKHRFHMHIHVHMSKHTLTSISERLRNIPGEAPLTHKITTFQSVSPLPHLFNTHPYSVPPFWVQIISSHKILVQVPLNGSVIKGWCCFHEETPKCQVCGPLCGWKSFIVDEALGIDHGSRIIMESLRILARIIQDHCWPPHHAQWMQTWQWCDKLPGLREGHWRKHVLLTEKWSPPALDDCQASAHSTQRQTQTQWLPDLCPLISIPSTGWKDEGSVKRTTPLNTPLYWEMDRVIPVLVEKTNNRLT